MTVFQYALLVCILLTDAIMILGFAAGIFQLVKLVIDYIRERLL